MFAGRMYFFKDDSYYLFDGIKLDVEDGYPRLIDDKWSFCSEHLEQIANSTSTTTMSSEAAHQSSLYRSIVHITLAVCLSGVVRLHCSL